MEGRRRYLAPLALATMATQAGIVVLVPIIVEIGRDLGTSVSAVGQARSILAGTAVVGSLWVGSLIDRLGVRPVLIWGGSLSLAGAAATAAAPSLPAFYAAQVLVGGGVACLLSGGFAGVASFFHERDAPWAMGYVVGCQAVAWIAGAPLIGLLTDAVSWRLAYAVPAAVSALALLGAVALLPRDRASGAGRGGEPGARDGFLAVVRDVSARRWAIAELVAYSAWTAELTYAGAFYVQSYGTGESAVGLLLAVGSLAFVATTLSTARLARRVGQRRLILAGGIGMGVLFVPVLNLTPSVWFTLAVFSAMAMFAGVRSTGASTVGLSQLPSRPGAMMAARTTAAQLGYMIGAVAGGAVLAVADFGTLGFVLFAGMGCSALLFARVDYRSALDRRPRERTGEAPSGAPDLARPRLPAVPNPFDPG